MQSSQEVNAMAAGNLAAGLAQQAYAFAAAVHEVQPSSTADPPSITTPTVVEAAAVSPWPCISTAETGGIPATGPTYWTRFGMVTDIITEYGTPTEQQHVFSGTASWDEEVDIGARFAADHGFGGWGYLTRQKCNL